MEEKMMNEVFEEVAEEVVKGTNSRNKFGYVCVGAGTVVLGTIVYKYAVKPGIKKLKDIRAENKAKKGDTSIDVGFDEIEE